MNILYIDHYAGSPEMGMEFRPYYFAREWVKMGHTVSMIAGDYSHLRKKNPTVKKDMEKETIDGIDYYWLKTGEYEGNGVKRALTMLRFCYKLEKWKNWIVKNLKPDVVISSSTYPIDSMPAYSIAHGGKKKAKYIHEVHDMWPATLVELGGMSKAHPFVMMMQVGENYAYSHADTVVSLPNRAKKYMIAHGLKPDGFVHIPNGVVLEEWENPLPLPDEHKDVLEEIKATGDMVVGYFGGHALSNCLDQFIDAARKLQKDKVHFVLVGDGVEKPRLMDAAKDLKNVTFLSTVDKKAVPTLTEYFDCVYMGSMASPLYRFGASMNKMYDSMMAGRPIIFALNAKDTPVKESGCGIMVPPENVNAICKAVRTFEKMSKEERDAMGARGRQMALKEFIYEVLAKKFEQLFF